MTNLTKSNMSTHFSEYAIYLSSLEKYKQLMNMSAFHKIEWGRICRTTKLRR